MLALQDILRLEPFGALVEVEFHRVPRVELAPALGLDRRVVDEDVASVPPLNEPKSLRIIEPFHFA